MKKLVILAASLVVGVELLVLLIHQRQFVLWAAGVVLAVLLLGICWSMGRVDSGLDQADSDNDGDSLRRWISSTETLIHWSESTRTDWDRHWRPILSRQFESTTGQRRAKDRAAFDATGRMLFGAGLWEWVDPGNVAYGGGDEPGPGRAALEEILQRLERQ